MDRRAWLGLRAAALALSLLASGCDGATPAAAPDAWPTAAALDRPVPPSMRVTLQPLQLAPRGGTLRVLVTVEARADSGSAEVFVALPRGMVPVRGKTVQYVKLERQVPRSFPLELLLLETGVQEIRAGAVISTRDGARVGDTTRLAIDVGERSSDVYPLLAPFPAGTLPPRRGPFGRSHLSAGPSQDEPVADVVLACTGGEPPRPRAGQATWLVGCDVAKAPPEQRFARLTAWLIGPGDVIATEDLCTTQLHDGDGECGKEVSVADPAWGGTAIVVGTLLPSRQQFGPAAVLAEIEP
jgi:hypothetical protein